MWGRTSSGRENGARFTAGHHYEVGGALGPVPGHSGGERCASPNPTVVYHIRVGKGLMLDIIFKYEYIASQLNCSMYLTIFFRYSKLELDMALGSWTDTEI